MKFSILKNPYDINSYCFFTIYTDSKEWNKWEKIVAKRFSYSVNILKTEEERQKYFINNPVYNADESRELGIMSLEHFLHYVQFIKDNLK
jgi:hypothetical protein